MAAQRVVQAVPIKVGIVEVQLDAVSLAGIGQFLQDIALEGGGIDDVIVAGLALEHREAVVVTRGDGDVTSTGILDGAYPLVGIKARWIETCGQLGILVTVDALVEHDPLAIGEHRIDTPVDKDTELVVLELLAGLEVLLGGDIGVGLGSSAQAC